MEKAPIAESQSVSVEDPSKTIDLPMGHRSSKTAIENPISSADTYTSFNLNQTNSSSVTSEASSGSKDAEERNDCNTNRIPIPLPGTTINVQIQKSSAAISDAAAAIAASSNTRNQQQNDSNSSSSLTSLAGNSLQNRQIIIKIQLAKMENGNEPQVASTTHRMDGHADEPTTINAIAGASANATIGSLRSDRDSLEMSVENNSTQFVNLTVNGNFIYSDDGANNLVPLSSDNSSISRTAGGCGNLINNISRDFSGRMNALQIQEDWEQQQRADTIPEYCEVLEENLCPVSHSLAKTNEHGRSDSNLQDTIGCLNGHRRTKTGRSPSSSSSSSGLSRRRCRDAFRRILEPSANKTSNKSKKQNKKHSDSLAQVENSVSSSNTVLSGTSSQSHLRQTATPGTAMTSTSSMAVTMTATPSSNNLIPISIATMSAPTNSANSVNPTSQVSATIWAPSQNDLIIPITSPQQFVVVQCPPTSVVTLGRIDYNSIRLSSTEIGHTGVNNVNRFITSNVPTESLLVKQIHNGPIVHSQVDFVHCLVPDLEKIINSSFYWGKIDRYEAERLLEGKPEGTFLLRDSAQEEYLFSVTFRKFGRSLHARIEQSGHKFGFDCHDPSVFTAPTVTGLLQHYKDPSCVMFFEPMLTIPLHRKTTFSLQELARGVIVTNTTYDGIDELGLPVRLKAFLKEYYYKQKLRVKPFDKTVYSCT